MLIRTDIPLGEETQFLSPRARNVLALDLGFSVGWARSDGRNGVAEFKQPDHGEALAAFSDWIEAMLDEERLDALVVERGFFAGQVTSRGRFALQMAGIAHANAYARNISRTDRSADQVRTYLLGYARIPKKVEPKKARRDAMIDEAVLAAVRARGFEPSSEHAADACGLICAVEMRAAGL